jgi:hypothetical protein
MRLDYQLIALWPLLQDGRRALRLSRRRRALLHRKHPQRR